MLDQGIYEIVTLGRETAHLIFVSLFAPFIYNHTVRLILQTWARLPDGRRLYTAACGIRTK